MSRFHHPHTLGPFVVADRKTEGSVISVHDLLSEPADVHPDWTICAHRRLLAVSTGAIGISVLPPASRDRLEAAGLLTVTDDADREAARSATWPALPRLSTLQVGWGSPRPSLVLVGERTTYATQLPFASKSGWWLLRALRSVGYDELTIYLANAFTHLKVPRDAELRELYSVLAPSEPTWVALGARAHAQLEKLELPHRHANHPMYHRRFEAGRGPEDYGAHLLQRGVPPGPNSRPLHSTGNVLRDLPPPWDPPKWTTTTGTSPRTRTIPPRTELEKARRLYVSGEADSLADAAKRSGVNPNGVWQANRAENWKAEREEHARKVTQAVLETDVRRQAQAVQETMGNTTEAARLMSERILDMLTSGDLPVNTRTYKDLVGTLSTLARTGLSDAGGDVSELHGLSTEELAKEVLKRYKKMAGEQVEGEAEEG